MADGANRFALVTGAVRLRLYQGNVIVEGRKSPYSLYDEDVATFEAKTGAPLLEEALVNLDCRVVAIHDAGDDLARVTGSGAVGDLPKAAE